MCDKSISHVGVVELQVEYMENPVGIDVKRPRLSWRLLSEGRNQKQTAYQILVSTDSTLLISDSADLWNSGWVNSDEMNQIEYLGRTPISRETCYWKLRILDQDSAVSAWSKIANWSMGLLDSSDWKAQWIGFDEAWSDSIYRVKPWGNRMDGTSEYKPLPCPYLRKSFMIENSIESANIYVTALGIYELYINGIRVGEDCFTPGWTDYTKRVYYKTYEVSSLLNHGENTVGVILADGWYAGNIANRGQYYYGKKLRFKMQLEIAKSSGAVDVIATNNTWRASYGPIREADMQGGETYDARLKMNGWNTNDFDDSQWKDVVVSDSITTPLQPYPSLGVRKTEEIKPVEIVKRNSGTYIVDMGQNFAGWVRLKVSGSKGDSIVLRYAEKLNEKGALYTRNLRTARATDTYVVRNDGSEVWEPRFTYHGFQFVEISGYSGELKKEDVIGVVVHSNLDISGDFDCSNPLVNKLFSNIVWSQRSNYFDVPTDCPQRDERMGWTGDAQVFMQTAAYNMNIAPFYTKWLVDITDGQYENGRFPSTAPRVYKRVAAGWGDAGVLCPWTMYQWYGDKKVLHQYYPNMVRWINHIEERSPNYISTLGSYGDWQNVESETPINLIATAYFKHSVDVMIEIARVLDKQQDVSKYIELSGKIKQAFIDTFFIENDQLRDETQTSYLMALDFDLIPKDSESNVVGHLLNTIYASDTSLSTGILGTKLLLPILTKYGHIDLAYRLLLNEQYPSWGNQINNGATTIWERWNSYSSFQGFHEDSTNSLNHYAYGSVGEWFYKTIGGIQSLEPGFKKVLIHPMPGGGLTFAKADYKSIRGMISSHWEIKEGKFYLVVEIPVNTTGTIILPADDVDSILEGGLPIASKFEVETLNGEVHIDVASGKYRFETVYTDE